MIYIYIYIYIYEYIFNKKEEEETKLLAGPNLLIKTFRQFCFLSLRCTCMVKNLKSFYFRFLIILVHFKLKKAELPKRFY